MYGFDVDQLTFFPFEHVELQNWGNMPHKPPSLIAYISLCIYLVNKLRKSMCQTDTVSYVKMMYFTSILQVISPILLLWFMLLAYISNLWILWAKSITVKPLMFTAINVWVFMSRTISLPLKFAFYMRNISLIYIFADSAQGCLNHC